ncbi:iron-containing alcohol dehydrogenase [Glycomyces tenuis]|uniref:iron-containing alcohol dehydrogenase n=1 Tax=Glycomyces tenuis TaxID=58116 RepID=UPI000416DAC6|nr:iron-containing alcohol dehydrogenase [Glycomyces tenuis]
MTANPSAVATDWQVPTLVAFGVGRAAEFGPRAAALGSAPAVLIDARVAETDVGRDLLARLSAHRVPAASVTRVAGVPTLGDVQAAAEAVTLAGADAVIGVGGGSTMDTAKLAALLAVNPRWRDAERWRAGPLLDLDADREARLRPGLPTLLLPTTTATGSELNSVAALVFEGRRRLMITGRLAPTSAVIDPALNATLPARAVLEGGVETLARILCPYLAAPALGVTDALAEALAARCVIALDRVHAAPVDLEARAELAWIVAVSATQLVALGRGRYDHVLWYLQDPLCTMLELAKGTAMASLLPAYLAAIRAGASIGPRLGDPDRLRRLDRALAPALGRASLAEALAERLATWGLPVCLADLEVASGDAERLARACHESWHATGRLSGAELSELEAFFRGAREAAPSASPSFTPAAATSPGAEIQMKGGE